MLNKIVLVILLSLSVYADSILTNYRENGIENIEQQMDLELTNVSYWNEHLKDIDTSFGYIEAYSTVLTCNKEMSTLNLYKQGSDKKFAFKKNYNAFTGKAQGDKHREGDLKTPLGIYDLTKKISKLDSFYGPLAFVTSYPNTYDKYRGKNGSGIWIHGLPTEQERDEFTKGCIAIDNSSIECLDRQIDINSTMLIIDNAELNKDISKDKLSKILAGLYEWRYSWLYNDTERYLSFYSSDFTRFDGMRYDEFTKYKTRIFNKNEKKKIIFKNINVIPYPNTEDVFQITFKEIYASRSYRFTGNKVLMIKVDKDNNFKIFTEK